VKSWHQPSETSVVIAPLPWSRLASKATSTPGRHDLIDPAVRISFETTEGKDHPMKKTHHGSCHCGKVRFEADVDLSAGTVRCNCSICAKRRYWGMIVKPEEFRLLAGEAELADYQFASMSAHHRFCRTCGIAPFGHGYIAEIGGAYYSINIACLDDIDPVELAELPISYVDGRNDNWWNAPAETRYL
jgi:hypothetical protein